MPDPEAESEIRLPHSPWWYSNSADVESGCTSTGRRALTQPCAPHANLLGVHGRVARTATASRCTSCHRDGVVTFCSRLESPCGRLHLFRGSRAGFRRNPGPLDQPGLTRARVALPVKLWRRVSSQSRGLASVHPPMVVESCSSARATHKSRTGGRPRGAKLSTAGPGPRGRYCQGWRMSTRLSAVLPHFRLLRSDCPVLSPHRARHGLSFATGSTTEVSDYSRRTQHQVRPFPAIPVFRSAP